jgi:hypothetical protein
MITPDQREIRRLRNHLRLHVKALTEILRQWDLVMQEPSTETRGKHLAQLANAVEFQRDCLARFALGVMRKR